MAHYDPHGNRDYDGYVVGYSATSESYMASTEEVVRMSGYPARPDLHSQIWPRVQPKTSDHEYSRSPKFAHANGSPHDSPRKGGQYPRQYGAHPISPHDPPHSPKFANGDSPRKVTFHGVNSPPTEHYSPPGGHYSSKYGPYPNSPSDSPRKNFRGGFSSNDHEDDSSDEDGECRDGVCYPEPKYGAGGKQGYGYEKDQKKGNGYGAGNYPVQHTTDQQPRKDPCHQKSDGRDYYGAGKQPEGNHIYGHAKPTASGGGYYTSENEPYAVPPPIKTRPERRDGGDNGRSSPVLATPNWTPFAESPRRGNKGRGETIDSTEAQRRYGNTEVPRRYGNTEAQRRYGNTEVPRLYGNTEVPRRYGNTEAQRRYGNTEVPRLYGNTEVPRRYGNAPPQYGPPADRRFAIDSKTAAMKYGGLFVN